MNKLLFPSAGLAGALAVAWVAAGYLQGHPLALAMTLLIGAVYAAGVAELLRHQRGILAEFQPARLAVGLDNVKGLARRCRHRLEPRDLRRQ